MGENHKYLELNNELLLILHCPISINNYNINKILELKSTSEYILLFDSLISSVITYPSLDYKYSQKYYIFEFIIKIMIKLEKKNILLNLNNSTQFFNTLILIEKSHNLLKKIINHINYSNFSNSYPWI